MHPIMKDAARKTPPIDDDNNDNNNNNNSTIVASRNDATTTLPSSSLEDTIRHLEDHHTFMDPIHFHSFQQVNFLLGRNDCLFCRQRLQLIVIGSNNNIVKCIACHLLAHRSCATSTRTAATTTTTTPCCVVNCRKANIVPRQQKQQQQQQQQRRRRRSSNLSGKAQQQQQSTPQIYDNFDDFDSAFPLDHSGSSSSWSASSDYVDASDACLKKDGKGDCDNVGAAAVAKTTYLLDSESKAATEQQHQHHQQQQIEQNIDNDVFLNPLKHGQQTWNIVAQMLQDSLQLHFTQPCSSVEAEEATYEKVANDEKEAIDNELAADSNNDVNSNKNNNNLLSQTWTSLSQNLKWGGGGGALVLTAGSLVSGVAGVAVVAGVLGIVLEGSVGVGIIVAGLTAGVAVQQQQQHLHRQRTLTMGEKGRQIVLLRPNVQIDPIWDELCRHACQSAPSHHCKLPFLSNGSDHARYARDADIVQSSEDELSTPDKVLLLVSRILNDKTSLAGHVYRDLVGRQWPARCRAARQALVDGDASITACSSRARRDDTHAVIGHVTVTLLQMRPDLQGCMELVVGAVESLVFGQLYDDVMEEIVEETRNRDEALAEKVLEWESKGAEESDASITTSDSAVAELRRLPEAHSAVDKLDYCVRFVEIVAQQAKGNVCADALLQLVCCHILLARVPQMNAQVAWLEEFARDEQLLRGREGYALVTLQASLHFVNQCQDLSELFLDDVEDEGELIAAVEDDEEPEMVDADVVSSGDEDDEPEMVSAEEGPEMVSTDEELEMVSADECDVIGR